MRLSPDWTISNTLKVCLPVFCMFGPFSSTAQGIEPELLSSGNAGHWGLSGMREPAEKAGARLRILSQHAAGTEVELTVPGKLAYARTNLPSLWNEIKSWTPGKDRH